MTTKPSIRVNTVDDDTIREIGRLFGEGFGSKLIAEKLGMKEGTVERIVAGRTINAVRVLGGSLTQGKRRTATQLARDWSVPPRRTVVRAVREPEPKPVEKPGRVTIFDWVREWEQRYEVAR